MAHDLKGSEGRTPCWRWERFQQVQVTKAEKENGENKSRALYWRAAATLCSCWSPRCRWTCR